MRIILPTIVEPEFSMIRGCQSASAVWDTLASNYRDTSLIHQCNILEQFYALRKTSDVSIDAYISKFSKLYEEIKTFTQYIRIHEAFIITRFLRSLPSEFAHFAHSYDHVIKTTKLADVFGALRSEWDNRIGTNTTSSKTPVVLNAHTGGKKTRKGKPSQSMQSTSSSSSTTKFCDFCKRSNHTIDKCSTLKQIREYEQQNGKSSTPSATSKPPPYQGSLAVHYEGGLAISTAMSAVIKTMPSSPDTWIIDSGSSDYMVPHRDWFIDYTPISDNSPRTIYGVRGYLPIAGIGSVVLTASKNSQVTL